MYLETYLYDMTRFVSVKPIKSRNLHNLHNSRVCSYKRSPKGTDRPALVSTNSDFFRYFSISYVNSICFLLSRKLSVSWSLHTWWPYCYVFFCQRSFSFPLELPLKHQYWLCKSHVMCSSDTKATTSAADNLIMLEMRFHIGFCFCFCKKINHSFAGKCFCIGLSNHKT